MLCILPAGKLQTHGSMSLENMANRSEEAKIQLQKLQVNIGHHQGPLRQTELLYFRNNRVGVAVQLLKWLPCKHEGQNSTPTFHVLKNGYGSSRS